MPLRPLSDVTPADWFVGQDVRLLGPAGFEAYVRVLHPWIEGVDGQATERTDGYLPDRELAALAELLTRHTTTPDHCFFGLWDGYGELYGGESTGFLTAFAAPMLSWPGRVFKQPRPKDPPPPAFPAAVLEGPKIRADLDYLLFEGPLNDAGDWGAIGYGVGIPRSLNSPNLVWPDDHAWFVSTDIEGSWTGVGGPRALIDDLLRDPRLEVVRTRHDDPAGMR